MNVERDEAFANEATALIRKRQPSNDSLETTTTRPTSSSHDVSRGWKRSTVAIVLLVSFLGILAYKVNLVLHDTSGSNPYSTTSMFFRRFRSSSSSSYFHNDFEPPNVSVAFIGNSMTFYNDLPRFVQALSDNHIVQNSCLHPSVSMTGILKTGSGMYDKFNTEHARNDDGVYDFGVCTVKQLLLGRDEDLEQQVFNNGERVYVDDGTNPCLRDPSYLTYLNTHSLSAHNNDNNDNNNAPPHWDFVVINDITRGPGRPWNRAAGMNILQDVYIPWFLEIGATPIFFDTHGYLTDERDLKNVPTFTSLTYFGYLKYSTLVSRFLPESQSPRIAPVGIAFLTVWEENRGLWYKLFHSFDLMHASTSGTFLTGCVIYYAIYGRMPDRRVVFRNKDVAELWSRARVLHELPPSFDEANYLYNVAERVMRLGHRPKSLKVY